MRIKALKKDIFTNPPWLPMLVMIWASIYCLASSEAVSDRSIPDMGIWNPSLEVSGWGDSSEEGIGLAGFLDSLGSGHVLTSPGSSDQEVVADERNNPCSTPKMMRRDPQSCIISPAPANTNTRGSVGNPDNNEGSGEHQEPSNDGIFKPLPGEQFFHGVLDWDFTNLQGWQICPKSKSDNKPLIAVCDSGRPEDILSAGIGWALLDVMPCTYYGYHLA